MGYSKNIKKIVGEDSVRRFLVEMNKERVKVCVWKSSDRWEEGITGNTDLDLLVASEYFDSAIANLTTNQWFPVLAEPWRRFDGVMDFVSYQSGFTQHIHLHSRIVSGEKLVKSFSPDFTPLYLDSASKEGYPYFVKPELEFVTFILRMSLKLGWRDLARVIKRRTKQALFLPFVGEYRKLKARIDAAELEAVLKEKELKRIPREIIKKASQELITIALPDIWTLRSAISEWRSTRGPKLLLKTIRRSIMKNFGGVGKPLLFNGVSIAVCGPDGSGKTTLVSALNAEIGKQIKVKSYYLGGSAQKAGSLRSWFRRITIPIYLFVRKVFKIARSKWWVDIVENMYARVDGYMMDRDKRMRLRSGRNYAKDGGITIYERFPLFSPYGDGLRGDHHIAKEDEPDVFVLISVDAGVAQERRPRDPQKRLEAKVRAFNDFGGMEGPYKGKILHLDGTKPTLQSVGLILQHLNTLICQKPLNQQGLGQTGDES